MSTDAQDQPVRPGRGGRRPGAGRPATGRTWRTYAVSLRNDVGSELERRASGRGVAISAFIRDLVEHELRKTPRPGEA
jgi:hypothetical protein